MAGFSNSVTSTIKGKVAVLGAAGGIGQPLSLLLKELPSISQLSLYDIANMGMATDLSHINTAPSVTAYCGEGQLEECLRGAQVVVIPAGVPRKPGMTRDDLFNINASIVYKLTKACAQACPEAFLLLITNPVNSTVPIARETLVKCGVKSPRVFGITTLDAVRANTFVSQLAGVDVSKVSIPVIGGHSGPTIIPLFSHFAASAANSSFSTSQLDNLTQRVQYGGDEVVKAKEGGGSATLSMAFAAREFIRPFLESINGVKENTLVCFVYDQEKFKHTGGYLAVPVKFSNNGNVCIMDIPKMNSYENALYAKGIEELRRNVEKGVDFVSKQTD